MVRRALVIIFCTHVCTIIPSTHRLILTSAHATHTTPLAAPMYQVSSGVPPISALSARQIYIFFTTKRFRSAIDYIFSADKEELLPTTGPQDSPQVGGSKSGSQVVPLENTDEFYQKKEMRETDLLEDDMMHHSKPLLDAEKNSVECEEKEAPPEVMRLLTWEKIFYQACLCRPCHYISMFRMQFDEQLAVDSLGQTQNLTLQLLAPSKSIPLALT